MLARPGPRHTCIRPPQLLAEAEGRREPPSCRTTRHTPPLIGAGRSSPGWLLVLVPTKRRPGMRKRGQRVTLRTRITGGRGQTSPLRSTDTDR